MCSVVEAYPDALVHGACWSESSRSVRELECHGLRLHRSAIADYSRRQGQIDGRARRHALVLRTQSESSAARRTLHNCLHGFWRSVRRGRERGGNGVGIQRTCTVTASRLRRSRRSAPNTFASGCRRQAPYRDHRPMRWSRLRRASRRPVPRERAPDSRFLCRQAVSGFPRDIKLQTVGAARAD